MAVIPATYGQVNFLWGGTSLPTGAETTWGFSNNAAGSATAAAQFFHEAWSAAAVMAQLSAGVRVSGVLVKLGPNATGASVQIGLDLPGGLAQNPVAANTSILIRKLTALGGRAGRGRSFMPGLSELDTNDANEIAGSRVEGLNDALEDFRDRCDAGGYTLVILHNPGAPLTTPTEVTQLAVDSIPATQRRRLRR